MQTYIPKKTTIYVPSPRNLLIAAINCVLLMSRSSNLTFLIVPIKLDVPVKNMVQSLLHHSPFLNDNSDFNIM